MPETRDLAPNDDYVQSLHKLLPAELTAVHLTIRTAAGGNPQLIGYLLGFALLLGVIFYFIAPQLLKLADPIEKAFYCITFFVWVISIEALAISNDLLKLPTDQHTVFLFIVSGMSAIWSFLIPYLLLMRRKQ